jgi:hypothetical protein
MRSDAVLGRARIGLSIYSGVDVQCYVRQGYAMQRIAWKCKDSLINFCWAIHSLAMRCGVWHCHAQRCAERQGLFC